MFLYRRRRRFHRHHRHCRQINCYYERFAENKGNKENRSFTSSSCCCCCCCHFRRQMLTFKILYKCKNCEKVFLYLTSQKTHHSFLSLENKITSTAGVQRCTLKSGQTGSVSVRPTIFLSSYCICWPGSFGLVAMA